jgi:hypothetical protein
VVSRASGIIALSICSSCGSYQSESASRYLEQLATILIFRSGAWIVLPTYLGYVFGAEIIQGLEFAAGGAKKEQ